MDRKGQLTLFIIIGIVLVFSVAIILYIQQQALTSFKADELSALSNEMQPVKLYVDKCIEDTVVPGIIYLGTQGGYLNPPLETLFTENALIPYYYNKGANTMPSLNTLQDEIAAYVESAVPVCTDGFTQFPFNITTGAIKATARIGEQNIVIGVKYPITAKLSGKEEHIENFVLQVPIRLGHIYDIAQQVVQKETKTPDQIDLAYFSRLDVGVNVLPYDKDSSVIVITDSKSKINGIPYQLFFANKFGIDAAPELDFTPDFVLKKDVPFDYIVTATDADGDKVTFSDDTNLFDINPETGEISFIPRTTGVYNVVITVSDGKKQDSTRVRFDVK